MTTYQINLHEAIYSLTDALDLVGVTHIHHGKRVAYLATAFAETLGWPAAQCDRLFLAAMLHDCGVSRTRVHLKLREFSWEDERDHCKIGAAMLGQCALLASLADVVLHHHTHWSDYPGLDVPEQIRELANCIYLADRVDILSVRGVEQTENILLARDGIVEKIVAKRGDWFAPALVDAFLANARSEAFWFRLERGHVSQYAREWVVRCPSQSLEFATLRELVYLFSMVVDAKSAFTSEHSDGVASLARHLGQLFALPERSCELLELAGLLHDIGKLRVPDEILEKPAPLTTEEFAVMRRHSFDTLDIIKNIHGLEEVASWASQHHERADGSGYPFHLRAEQLTLEARILAVADVFQALAQNRPYRHSLPATEVLAILKAKVAEGALDAMVVDRVETDLDNCWRAALPYLRQAEPAR